MLDARREAIQAGAGDVRAEHLLLALAASQSPAGRLLSDAGLDRDAVVAALAAEREHSLAAVGMVPMPTDRLRATISGGNPGWGASAKEALLAGRRQAHDARRTAQVARRMQQKARRLDQAARRFEETARRIERGDGVARSNLPHGHDRSAAGHGAQARPGPMSELDLLHGILSAELGTVPRALALAGFDRGGLLDALDGAGGEP